MKAFLMIVAVIAVGGWVMNGLMSLIIRKNRVIKSMEASVVIGLALAAVGVTNWIPDPMMSAVRLAGMFMLMLSAMLWLTCQQMIIDECIDEVTRKHRRLTKKSYGKPNP